MSDWSLEHMEPDGWERVRAVRLRALSDAPDAFGSTHAEEQAQPEAWWRGRIAVPEVATILATLGGRDVGITVGCPYEGRAGAMGLFAMWVAPEARGRGVGGGLVDAVVAWARRGAFERVLLDVADENEAAVRLYASKGFEPTGATGVVSSDRAHISEHERALALQPGA